MLLGMLMLPEEQIVVINYLLGVPSATHKQLQSVVAKLWADTTLENVLEKLTSSGYIEKFIEDDEQVYRINLGRAHTRTRRKEPSAWDSVDWNDL